MLIAFFKLVYVNLIIKGSMFSLDELILKVVPGKCSEVIKTVDSHPYRQQSDQKTFDPKRGEPVQHRRASKNQQIKVITCVSLTV